MPAKFLEIDYVRQTWLRAVALAGAKSEACLLAFVWRLPPVIVYWAGIRLLANATTGQFGERSPSGMHVFGVLEDWRHRRGGDRRWTTELKRG